MKRKDVLAPEGFALPQEAEVKSQKSEDAWWKNKYFIIFITIAMSVMDALVLYTVMDEALTQSELLGKLTSFGIALVENIIPLFVAQFVLLAMYGMNKAAKPMAIIGIIAYACLFGGTVALRFAFQDSYKPSSEMTLVETEKTEVDKQYEEKTLEKKANATVILLSIEPFATSLTNFVLAIFDDPVKKKLNCLYLRDKEIDEGINTYTIISQTILDRREELYELDLKERLAKEKEIENACAYLKEVAVNMLEDYLKSPDSSTYINEQTSNQMVETTDYLELNPNQTEIYSLTN